MIRILRCINIVTLVKVTPLQHDLKSLTYHVIIGDVGQRQLSKSRHPGKDISAKLVDVGTLEPEASQVGQLQLGAGILQVRQDLVVVVDWKAQGEFQPPSAWPLQDEECEALKQVLNS